MTNDTRQGTRSRVALVLPDLSGGGAERSVLELATGLAVRGYAVDIVVFRNRVHYPTEVSANVRLFVVENRPDERTKQHASGLLQRFEQLDAVSRRSDCLRMARALKWDPLCLPGPRLIREARAVATYLENEEPDCILPSLPRAKAATLLASRLMKENPPVIPVLRNFVPARRLRHRRRYMHLFPFATHFVGISQGVSESLADVIRIPKERITTIYNPVVTPRIRSQMALPPEHPWFSDNGPPVIVSAGRLATQKDHVTLIKAFARLAARRPCRLVIVGEGKLRRRLDRLIGRLGLSSRVSLPGWVDNPYSLMARAACFALSSRHEGLGRVLIEALACGCPCVSTDCPAGPAEILQSGNVGALVPVGDDAALAEAMERVLESPPRQGMLEERAAYFSSERAVAAYDQLIGTLTRSRGH